jgi:choline kinase
MKALILNSGMGRRMGDITNNHPKCMTKINGQETILSRQLEQLYQCGIRQVVITTGLFDEVLRNYCESLNLPVEYTFVFNPYYDRTNYIYSIYLARECLNDDIILMHGDLVFENKVLEDIIKQENSSMTVSSTLPLPKKDFKAVIKEGLIQKIGIEFFDNAVAAQPLYKLNKKDWVIWLDRIIDFCESGQVSCYAENAFNDVADRCQIYPMDIASRLCGEIDTPDDLARIKDRLELHNDF